LPTLIERLVSATDAELLAAVAESETAIVRLQYEQLAMLAELNSRS
jgi:hypothetical protein